MTPTADLLSEPPPDEPLALVGRWLADAMARRLQPNPNAMVLATTGADGHPSARVVLLKDLIAKPGFLVFYTNYESRKGLELAGSPHAAAVMHWDQLQRQGRGAWPLVRSPPPGRGGFFASRPRA